ncbi:Fatty acid-binding -like protein 2 [Toxocara canis]|uniref:Fatty acid-binding-like protein 2 n=1 Tax=Toxocara canis TaxID=6265 RepID=A0A0B2V853_TOXCA|nr:Fatty acid-binding -like protein 2 [Toxocara canis]
MSTVKHSLLAVIRVENLNQRPVHETEMRPPMLFVVAYSPARRDYSSSTTLTVIKFAEGNVYNIVTFMRLMCEQFIGGEYQQDGAENLSEYLTAKGTPWLVRKLIDNKLSNHYFKLTRANDDGTYNIVLGSAKGKLEYQFKFDDPIIAIGYNGKKHKITFSMVDGKLVEKHEHLEGDRKGEDNDITEWKFDGDQLIAETPAVDNTGTTVVWKKFFKKLN